MGCQAEDSAGRVGQDSHLPPPLPAHLGLPTILPGWTWAEMPERDANHRSPKVNPCGISRCGGCPELHADPYWTDLVV